MTKQNHWYKATETGFEACYEVPKKSGTGMKRVTITEARELHLLPSVTSILGILAKPGLQNWLFKQHILAAEKLPRNPEEIDEDYCERVMHDADSVSKKARDLGTEIHDQIGKLLHFEGCSAELYPYLKSVHAWIQQEVTHIYAVEKVVGNVVFGFAGRLDLHCETKSYGKTIVDFKTQGIKRVRGIKTPMIHREFGPQLAAYAGCIDSGCSLVNIFIDTSEPGPIFCHEWTNHMQLWNTFLDCLRVWAYFNDYDPGNAHMNLLKKSSDEIQEPAN